MSNAIKLTSLTIHNDVRVRPGRNAGRVFRADEGYTLEWYPPHIFRVAGPADLKNPNENLYEKWFAVTNCEAWELEKPCGSRREMDEHAHDIEKKIYSAEASAKLQIRGLIDISESIQDIAKQIAGALKSKK